MRLPETHGIRAMQLTAVERPRPVQVIAVTGGKGGVGKTFVSANIAAALARHDIPLHAGAEH